ncbi:MAG: hypothetical protein GYA31_00760 [Parcubacteria group bacterium]|nr:hypothetical protein [Parcubacteria group bacterium]
MKRKTDEEVIVMKKNLYKATVLNFIPYGGKVKIYWIHAHSEDEATLLVAKKFNKEFHFDPQKNYVDMKIKKIKDKEAKENENE